MSNHKWELSQLEYIRNNAATMKDKDIAEELSKLINRKISIQSVRKQRQFMGLKKAQGRGRCSIIDKSGNTSSVASQPILTNDESGATT